MFKPLVLCSFLGLGAMAAMAQPGAGHSDTALMEVKDSARPAQAQERRTALRAALLAQREAASQQDNPSAVERQLNERERAELRQQLRQQRRQ